MIPAPRPWAIRRGNNRRVLYIRPLMLVSTMVSQSSRSHLGAGSTPRARPALLISPRSVAKEGGRLAMAASIAWRSRTSSTRPWTSVCFDNSAHRAFRRSSRRPVSTSFQPASAKRRAQASPKPDVAPVINRVLDIVTSWNGLIHSLEIDKQAAACPATFPGATSGFLDKKPPTCPSPCGPWPAANCTHLIHSPVHNLWGQVQKPGHRYPQGFAGRLKSFLLDPGRPTCRPPGLNATGRSNRRWLQASKFAALPSLSRV